MPAQFATCTNRGHCMLADQGAEVPMSADGKCPQCQAPMQPVAPAGLSFAKIALIAIAVMCVTGAGVLAASIYNLLTNPPPAIAATTSPASPQAAQPAAGGAPQLQQTVAVTETQTGTSGTSDGMIGVEAPDSEMIVPTHINLDPQLAENQQVKQEVLRRIDLMPNIPSDDKDKLYMHVERARSMGKVMLIPFSTGKINLTPADIENLRSKTQSAEIQKLLRDPTAVFVVLGFADRTGDEQKNLQISLQRAEKVLQGLREKCGFMNVMHPVAMGSSTLFDENNLDKNRVVEVWVVLP